MEILKNKDYNLIDGYMCCVSDFNPLLAKVENGKVISADLTTPYASLELECPNIDEPIKLLVTHKLDFLHLWQVVKDRGIKKDEELLVGYSSKLSENRNFIFKLLSSSMPKLIIMVCPKGAYEKIKDPTKKVKTGVEGFKEIAPIIQIDPIEEK